MNTIFEHGEFTDYAGQKHNFTVAGVVITPNTSLNLYKDIDYEELDIKSFSDDYLDCDYIDSDEYVCNIPKIISIGISICNPLDDFNEKRGFLQSEGRAIKYAFADGNPNQRIIAVNKTGMINDDTVKYFVHQTVNALSKNPGLFIKGYNGAAKKHNN